MKRLSDEKQRVKLIFRCSDVQTIKKLKNSIPKVQTETLLSLYYCHLVFMSFVNVLKPFSDNLNICRPKEGNVPLIKYADNT